MVLLLLRVLVLAALGILHGRTYLGHHKRRVSLSARAAQQRPFQAPNPDELLPKLQRANVNIKVKWNQTRVSPSVYNNDDDIDALLNALS